MNNNTTTPMTDTKTRATRIAFVILLIVCALPFVSTWMALAAGILFSLTLANPWPTRSAAASKQLLQVSVVGLGFGMNIAEVWIVGRSSLVVTAIGILLTMGLGLMIGRLVGTKGRTSALISFGTAICGGSAIAAMAPAIDAENDESAVALATVFTLNAVALILFPLAGHLMGLSQHDFGIWAGMAIHDTSSVVGAASTYGQEALDIGTTVKLSRAIWIAPIVMGVSYFAQGRGKARVPLFIIGFVVAAAVASMLPDWHTLWASLARIARQALVVTLFLIGAGLSPQMLRRVGLRPMIQGVSLWAFVSVLTLAVICLGWTGI
jgi:uncharacterized integral membrane protein (TIGR00698 family)